MLQEKLEAIIQSNPQIEDDIEELRRRAFLSHISAYTQAGFLDLPLCDKIEVGLTIKLDDLCSQEGLLQIRAMGVLQVRYYFKHPSALLADANYLQQNWNSILSEVYYYLNGTRSGTDEAVYELIDLLLGQQIQYYYDNVPGFYLPDY